MDLNSGTIFVDFFSVLDVLMRKCGCRIVVLGEFFPCECDHELLRDIGTLIKDTCANERGKIVDN